MEHLGNADGAAEGRGCAGEEGVDVALVGRDEGPGLDVVQSGCGLALAPEFVGFGVDAGAQVERLGEMAVGVGGCCCRGKDNVLKTHGRSHVWGEVEGCGVAGLMEERGPWVNPLEVTVGQLGQDVERGELFEKTEADELIRGLRRVGDGCCRLRSQRLSRKHMLVRRQLLDAKWIKLSLLSCSKAGCFKESLELLCVILAIAQ